MIRVVELIPKQIAFMCVMNILMSYSHILLHAQMQGLEQKNTVICTFPHLLITCLR